MKALNMVFKNALGARQTLKVSYINADELDADTLREKMEAIGQSGVFTKDGLPMYTTPISASYVDTQEHVVYDATQE
ncbi:DUF2922 domain-containing protein [Ligilactobacillus equi]|uniref:DUF2922 domain-containing protein n=1 Tax=Ligilactobacillus equi TaxID=137357 RepID=UPI002ED15996